MPERHNPSMPDKPWHIDTARTMVVNTVVVLELFYLFSVRYLYGASLTWRGVLGTPAVLLGISVIVGLQSAFTYIPWMQYLFQTTAAVFSRAQRSWARASPCS